MTANDFSDFYKPPTKLIKTALFVAEQLFCHLTCYPHCFILCPNHMAPHTLQNQFITPNHIIYLRPRILPINLPLPLHPSQPLPPKHILTNPLLFCIHSILNHKDRRHFDSNNIIKTYLIFMSVAIP
jgi:hypothetical protein